MKVSIRCMTDQRWKPSVTVAAVIVRQDSDGPRYLLVEEHTPEGLRLNNPAGHLEQGETPLQAVCRETLEETGCHFEPRSLVGVYLSRFQRPATAEDVTYLRLAYAGTCSPAEPGRALDDGIARTLWLRPDEILTSIPRHRSPLVWRCIEDHLAGRRFALDVVLADDSVRVPEIK
ncbi:MAG: NUDIX hydrolase [Rubrivivax sp.]|jgi:8-oxo-dGTP pyrophosphatase MutT (NUDIX family)